MRFYKLDDVALPVTLQNVSGVTQVNIFAIGRHPLNMSGRTVFAVSDFNAFRQLQLRNFSKNRAGKNHCSKKHNPVHTLINFSNKKSASMTDLYFLLLLFHFLWKTSGGALWAISRLTSPCGAVEYIVHSRVVLNVKRDLASYCIHRV